MKQTNKLAIISVMFCFFCMGFVDLVGIASNYVKADLQLSDSVANIFPSLVFFWFLIFSVPTGVLMNKIGRKKTVLLSLIVTAVSLLLPLFGESFPIMLCAFSLLGIGNALMQTSLNPLVTCVMNGGHLAAVLTFGQFIKAIASFIAPYLAIWGTTQIIPSFDYNWRILFAIFLVVGIFATALLATVEIEEPKAKDAAFATSLYFIFRTIGCFTGSFFLRILKARTFFFISVVLMAASMACLLWGDSKMVLYAGIALVGYGNSNIFSICFSNALMAVPQKQNEVSGLMIMGLFGGTLFPLVMGVASDAMGQAGAVLCMAVGVIYLFTYISKIK